MIHLEVGPPGSISPMVETDVEITITLKEMMKISCRLSVKHGRAASIEPVRDNYLLAVIVFFKKMIPTDKYLINFVCSVA